MATNKRIVTLLDCFGFHPRNDERRSPRNDEQPSLRAVPTPSLRAAGEAIQKNKTSKNNGYE